MTETKLLMFIVFTIGFIAITVFTIRDVIKNNRELRELQKEIDERIAFLRENLEPIDIVHCKDCKHVEYTPVSSWKRPYVCRIRGSGLGYCPDDGNGFCPYGERKESDGE